MCAQPFGKLKRFGNVTFNGISSSPNINQDWITTPTEIIDASYPIDPYNSGIAPMGIQKAVWDYALLINPKQRQPTWGLSYESNSPHDTSPPLPNPAPYSNLEIDPFSNNVSGSGVAIAGNSSLSAIEYQWNNLYMGFRQFNNQSSILVADNLGTGMTSPILQALYARARINSLELKLTPGKDTNSYVTKLQFILLSKWLTELEGGNAIASISSKNLGQTFRKDIHVPFGNVISFAGFTFSPRTTIFAPFTTSSIVEEYNIEWDVQFSIVPHSSYPLDHFGVSPCPMKPIQAAWELCFISNADSTELSIDNVHKEFTGKNYFEIYNLYNNFLNYIQSGNQQGPLIVNDANGNPGQCQARIKSYPLSLSPSNSNYLTAKIVFDIYSDWTYTNTTANYR